MDGYERQRRDMIKYCKRHFADAGEFKLRMDLACQYLSLGENFDDGGALFASLNHVVGDRWSCLQTTMDDKTR